jgi:hypothetical protein
MEGVDARYEGSLINRAVLAEPARASALLNTPPRHVVFSLVLAGRSKARNPARLPAQQCGTSTPPGVGATNHRDTDLRRATPINGGASALPKRPVCRSFSHGELHLENPESPDCHEPAKGGLSPGPECMNLQTLPSPNSVPKCGVGLGFTPPLAPWPVTTLQDKGSDIPPRTSMYFHVRDS